MGLLTAGRCSAADPAARQYVLGDGDGLELLVTPAGPRTPHGRKLWRFRYRFAGKRRRITFGEFPTMRLVAARAVACGFRSQLYGGADPGAAKVGQVAAPLLVEVVERYQVDRGPGWAVGTAKTYASQLRAFLAWADSAGVRRVDQLEPSTVADYRAHAIGRPRSDGSEGRRSPQTINGELKVVAAMLQVLRRAGRLPSGLTRDAIEDNLGMLPIEHTKPNPLPPADLRDLVAATRRYDADHEGAPAGPLVLAMLLGGFRLIEARRLTWDAVDLSDLTIRVAAGKTHRERTVELAVSPALVRLLAGMPRSGGPIFDFSEDAAMDARQRLIEDYGAPAFLWSKRHRARPEDRSAPTLRSTCASYLVCAPSIYGGASTAMTALQLGHSEDVLRASYLGAVRRIPVSATTLEDAMEIASELASMRNLFGRGGSEDRP